MIKKSVNVALISLVIVLASLAPIFAACDGHARKDTLKATIATVNTLRDNFIAWDRTAQQKIVDSATSVEDGQKKLAAYREGRANIFAAIATTYKLVNDALTDDSDATLKKAVIDTGRLTIEVRDFQGPGAP